MQAVSAVPKGRAGTAETWLAEAHLRAVIAPQRCERCRPGSTTQTLPGRGLSKHISPSMGARYKISMGRVSFPLLSPSASLLLTETHTVTLQNGFRCPES